MRHFLIRLLNDRRQLILLVLVLSPWPILRWFAAILLSLTTLRLGAKAGSQLALAMIASILLFVTFNKIGRIPASVQVINVLLLLALSVVLRLTGSWLLLLQGMSVLGLMSVALVHLLYPDVAVFWSAFLKPELVTLKSLPAALSGGLTDTEAAGLLDRLAHVATGLQVMILTAAALLNVAFGRYLQALLYNPGGLKAELYRLRLSPLYALLLMIVLLITWIFGQSVLVDCVSVVLLPLVVSGLSLVHYLTARSSRQSLWLVFCYIALLLFPPEVLVLLISASFIDAWWNIRQRYALNR